MPTLPNHVAIVTDSTADIPAELCTLLQIHVIPQIVVIEGQSLEDGRSLSRQDFYQRLPQMSLLPTTAAASSGTFEDYYTRQLQAGASHVLSIHLANELSGTMNTATLAAQSFPGRVTVLDSRSLSLGLGFQVIAAARAAQNGASLEEVLAEALAARQRVRLMAMLDTLEYIRRSGRVSWARARLGELLSIKPFLEVCDGKILSLGQVRTRQMGVRRLEELLSGIGKLSALAILHTNAEQDAQALLASLKNRSDFDLPEDPMIVNVTTVIGTHVGPKGLGFAALCA